MKCLLISILFFSSSIYGQPPVLKIYYEMKNALINADASNAAVKANEFIKAAEEISMQDLKNKIVADAKRIAVAADINKQRDYFASLSQNFYSVIKVSRITDQPIYRMYCPMKKMTWLSEEKNIQNPYYGNVMLNCGSITETINP